MRSFIVRDRNILIYGAGGSGRELAFSIASCKDQEAGWILKGFIDDTKELAGKTINGVPVVGGIEYLKDYTGNLAVTIFDDPEIRKQLILRIKTNRAITFPTLISTTSLVSCHARWGEGCIVNYFNVISPDVVLGDFVLVNSRCGIGHDAQVGDYATLYAAVTIGGGASVGAGCVIGSGTTVLPKIKIGAGTIIGAGALVTKDLPEGVLATGAPAKIKRKIQSL